VVNKKATVSIHDPIASLFNVPRRYIPSFHYRELRATATQAWRQIARILAV
jgi:putative transposase